ncbi:MAG: hypothetical protein KF816_06200 [Melioribacteraceae bacterium]|nr:hypothetical protein [Melioribacteraceae bacterium]
MRGGRRAGAGRKPYTQNPKNIRRLYRFSEQDVQKILAAVRMLNEKGVKICEAELVRNSVLDFVDQKLKELAPMPNNSGSDSHAIL